MGWLQHRSLEGGSRVTPRAKPIRPLRNECDESAVLHPGSDGALGELCDDGNLVIGDGVIKGDTGVIAAEIPLAMLHLPHPGDGRKPLG